MNPTCGRCDLYAIWWKYMCYEFCVLTTIFMCKSSEHVNSDVFWNGEILLRWQITEYSGAYCPSHNVHHPVGNQRLQTVSWILGGLPVWWYTDIYLSFTCMTFSEFIKFSKSWQCGYQKHSTSHNIYIHSLM